MYFTLHANLGYQIWDRLLNALTHSVTISRIGLAVTEKRGISFRSSYIAHDSQASILAANLQLGINVFPETISEKLNDAVIAQAMKLSAEERQELVISYVLKANEIWLVQGAEGFIMFENDEQVQLPVFPHRDLAQSFVTINGVVGECVNLPLNEFTDTWLPGLQKNGVELVMFPTTSDVENLVMEADDLAQELNAG